MTYLIWSNQHGQWWRPAKRGYTSIIDEAGRYSRAEAEAIVRDATCDGQLSRTVEDPITGETRTILDEVMVQAPEVTP